MPESTKLGECWTSANAASIGVCKQGGSYKTYNNVDNQCDLEMRKSSSFKAVKVSHTTTTATLAAVKGVRHIVPSMRGKDKNSGT